MILLSLTIFLSLIHSHYMVDFFVVTRKGCWRVAALLLLCLTQREGQGTVATLNTGRGQAGSSEESTIG